MISYGRQTIDDIDIESVAAALRSDFLTQGPKVPEFEKLLSTTTGACHSVVVNSATSALHLACLALGLKAGDRLWTSPISFVASANCGLYCNANVDFVDIDPKTQNLCPVALERKLKKAAAVNALPKIIVPVHFAGQPCDLRRIFNLSKKYGFHIVEDASHALGAYYEESPVGACKYSTITVFSFHAIKNITTSEGGAATTNDKSLWKAMSTLRSHGITKHTQDFTGNSIDPWSYEQNALGFNYRMSDLAAALGISQLSRLPTFIAKRRLLAEAYHKKFLGSPVTPPTPTDCSHSAWHLYVVQLDKHIRSRVFNQLTKKGIGVNVHYIPIYKQPYYQKIGFSENYCLEAERYYSSCLTLPLHPSLSIADVENIADEVIRATQ